MPSPVVVEGLIAALTANWTSVFCRFDFAEPLGVLGVVPAGADDAFVDIALELRVTFESMGRSASCVISRATDRCEYV